MVLGIYLSYAYRDQDRARELSHLLETEGPGRWSVVRKPWNELPAGQTWFDPWLQRMEAATVFLVLLSRSAISSEYVLREAEFAVEKERALLPVLIEDVHDSLPYIFRRYQWIDLIGWDGLVSDERLERLFHILDGLERG